MGTYDPTTINTTLSITPAAGDTELSVSSATGFIVGRDIVFTDGPSIGNIRRITAVDGTNNTITVDHAVGTTLWRLETTTFAAGSAVDEDLPASGNTVLQSNTPAEWAAADSDLVEDSTGTLYTFDGSADITVGTTTNTVFLSGENITLRGPFCGTTGNNEVFRIVSGSHFKLGHVYPGNVDDNSTNGYTANGCYIVDTSLNEQQDTDQGSYHFYGCHVLYDVIQDNQRTFWRMQSDDDSSRFRFVNLTSDNKWSFRVEGAKSLLLNMSQNHAVRRDGDSNGNSQASIGFFNGTSTVGHIRNITVRDSRQCVYHNSSFAGGPFAIGGLSFSGIDDRVLRIANGGGGGSEADPQISVITNINLDEVDALADGVNFAEVESVGSGSTEFNQIQTIQDFTVNILDDALNVITDSAKLAITDNQDADRTVATTSTGTFPTQAVEIERMLQDRSPINYGDTENTIYAPIDYGVHARGSTTITYTPVYLSNELRDVTNLDITLLQNTAVTEQDTTVVDAYTELTTAQNVYDYQFKYRFDNPYSPVVNDDLFTIDGDVLTFINFNPLVTANLTFSDAATDLISVSAGGSTTIKVPVSGYTGGVTTPFTTSVTVNNTVRGAFDCLSLLHTFADGDTIIDAGTGLQDYLFSLSPGTYTIESGDVSELSLFNNAVQPSDPVIIKIGSGVINLDDITLTTGVEIENTLTIDFENVDGGRLDIFDGDVITSVYNITDFSAGSVTISSTDETFLTTDNVLRIAWSGPDRSDFRDKTVTISTGANTISLTTDALVYPDAGTDFSDYSLTETTYVSDVITGQATAAFTVGDGVSLTMDTLANTSGALSATNTFDLAVGDFLYFTTGQFFVDTAITLNSPTATISGSLAGGDIADDEDGSSFNRGLKVALQISADGSLDLADGTTNEFIHASGYIRGTIGYNEHIAFSADTAINTFGSTGLTGAATVQTFYVKFTPRNSKSYTIGYLANTGLSVGTATVDRVVYATVGGVSDSATYSMTIPTSAAAFDIGTTAIAVANRVGDDLDERLVTRQNVGNASLAIPAVDADGNFITPDL